MKKFLFKTIAFAMVFAGICGLNYLVNTLIIEYSEFPVKKERVLIAGDSHMQFAIDPKVFYSAENISQTGEPYPVTFWKLKYIFEEYKPEILLLGFSHHNISAFNDHKFTDKKWCDELFKRSYRIGDFDGLSMANVDYDESTYYRTYLREMFLFPHLDHFNFVGRFTPGKGNHLAESRTAIDRHYFMDGKPLPVSEASVVYLDSIINLCLERQVVPVLIGTPVHKDYHTAIPRHILDRYEFEKQRLTSLGIAVLDLTGDHYDDSYFYDEDHLNESGAFIFTNRVIELLPQKKSPIELVKTSVP